MIWKENKLEEIATITSGFAFKANEMSDITGTALIKIKNINDRKVYKNTDTYIPLVFQKQSHQNYFLKDGDILVAMTGQGSVGRIGKMYNVDGDYLINQRVGIIRAKESICDKDFLFQILATAQNEKLYFSLAKGAGQPNLSPKDIGALVLSMPTSIETQRRIALILSSYDNLIENNLKRIKLLDEASQIYI
jgi:type I restriction enzyme S subunit